MRKIRIDFCDFWAGFCKTNNFFYHFLSRHFEVELHDRPDFLFYSSPHYHIHRLHNCVKIYYGVEPYLPDFRECDYAFTCHLLDNPRHLRLPFYVLYAAPKQLQKAGDNPDRILAEKSRFCSFVVSNPNRTKARKRVDFFHRLSRYKKVDSGGGFLNNLGYTVPYSSADKIEFLRAYKFNIAFENQSLPGYTTEKIVEAMAARCLPIYWGNPLIHTEFNPRSFLNYFDFANEEALIERIIELDQDEAKYRHYLQQPYFHHDQPSEYFDEERLRRQFEKIFTEKITPVSQRRKFFRLGRWMLVKRNR